MFLCLEIVRELTKSLQTPDNTTALSRQSYQSATSGLRANKNGGLNHLPQAKSRRLGLDDADEVAKPIINARKYVIEGQMPLRWGYAGRKVRCPLVAPPTPLQQPLHSSGPSHTINLQGPLSSPDRMLADL